MKGANAARRIRAARWRDRHAIRQLTNATYMPQLEQLGLQRHLQRINFWWLILNSRLWVLEDGRELVAVIGLQNMSIQVFVFLVAVLPGMQRRGFGRALIEFAEAESRRRGFYRIFLSVPEEFINAVEFYQHLGFVEAGRRVQDGHTFIDMLKRWDAAA